MRCNRIKSRQKLGACAPGAYYNQGRIPEPRPTCPLVPRSPGSSMARGVAIESLVTRFVIPFRRMLSTTPPCSRMPFQYAGASDEAQSAPPSRTPTPHLAVSP